MPYIDPRLSRHLQDATDDMLIDAIFTIVEENQNPLEQWNTYRFAEQILQQITQQNNEQPTFLRFIPRANAVALTATSRFINSLLSYPCVQVASSATIDPFHF